MAKSKRTLKVNPLAFHKVLKQLKKLERDNPQLTIKAIPVSSFLSSISDIETSTASISAQVKIAILKTNGETDPDPSTLADDTKMSDFGFSEIQLIKLADRFRKIAEQTNPDADVTPGQVEVCETVEDCIDLVVEAAE